MSQSAAYLDLRHDFFRMCAFCWVCAIGKNFLPRNKFKNRFLYDTYRIIIDLFAGFGGGWRADSPSLQQEWMGFKAKRTPRAMTIMIVEHPDTVEPCEEP